MQIQLTIDWQFRLTIKDLLLIQIRCNYVKKWKESSVPSTRSCDSKSACARWAALVGKPAKAIFSY